MRMWIVHCIMSENIVVVWYIGQCSTGSYGSDIFWLLSLTSAIKNISCISWLTAAFQSRQTASWQTWHSSTQIIFLSWSLWVLHLLEEFVNEGYWASKKLTNQVTCCQRQFFKLSGPHHRARQLTCDFWAIKKSLGSERVACINCCLGPTCSEMGPESCKNDII